MIQHCRTNVIILYGWSDYIYLVGSSFDYTSICEGGLTAGGSGVRTGRQTCFFTAVDPMEISVLTPRYELNGPRKIAYTLKWGRMHNAIFWSDLRLAQNSGLDSWQTINNAITLYESMPANCLVKVVKRNVDDTKVEILFEKGEPEQREVPRIVHQKKKPLT